MDDLGVVVSEHNPADAVAWGITGERLRRMPSIMSPARKLVTGLLLLIAVPALTSALVPGEAAVAAERGVVLPGAPPTKRVDLSKPKTARPVVKRAPYARFSPSGHTALPAAGTATVAVAGRAVSGVVAGRHLGAEQARGR